jgi:hypothetical protein
LSTTPYWSFENPSLKGPVKLTACTPPTDVVAVAVVVVVVVCVMVVVKVGMLRQRQAEDMRVDAVYLEKQDGLVGFGLARSNSSGPHSADSGCSPRFALSLVGVVGAAHPTRAVVTVVAPSAVVVLDVSVTVLRDVSKSLCSTA